ncbi:aldehyde dehydrogenase family protein [Variovorax defluvii]|uniref:aldehyde dehydrogenase family protein n=1 Tax=Variovorax defluvii TaxID=913761 RepID=UPI0031EF50BE
MAGGLPRRKDHRDAQPVHRGGPGDPGARGQADVDAAVAWARSALQGPWSRFAPAQRQQLILRFAELFEKHFDELTLRSGISVR